MVKIVFDSCYCSKHIIKINRMPYFQFQIDELIIKFLNGTITPDENIGLINWINDSEGNKQIFENITNKEWVAIELDKINEFDENAGWGTISSSLKQSERLNKRKDKKWYQFAAAATIMFALSIGSWFYLQNVKRIPSQNLSQKVRFGKEFKPPKSNNAILTLSDGREIILKNSAKDKKITVAGVEVTETKDGQVIYKVKNRDDNNVIIQNTLAVPRGSKPLQLVLVDGTKVWVNTGSSVIFPSKFIGVDRKVKMTGEVFFEVAKNKHMPFKVMANGVETEALGTQFNINAYSDEPNTKITLIEGSIKVEKRKNKLLIGSLIVKPNQQVIAEDRLSLTNTANISETMAWRNGQFYFEGANIKTIMNQISKWYNVDIEYKGNIDYSLVLKISKDVPMSELLKIMELTDLVRFKVEGKKIIVMEYEKK